MLASKYILEIKQLQQSKAVVDSLCPSWVCKDPARAFLLN